jgi:hypothetical protein
MAQGWNAAFYEWRANLSVRNVGTFPPATTDAYKSSDKLQMITNTMDSQQLEGRLTFSAPENGMIHCEERAPWEMVTVKRFQKKFALITW